MPRVGIDVRRLAAVDMHGLNGSRVRSRIILAEFALGAVGGIAVGVVAMVAASDLGWRLFGLAVVGIGLNYVPLALHARSLWRPGALAAEMEGADVRAELRYYTVAQLWVLVPLALVVFDLARRSPHRRGASAATERPAGS